MVLLLSFTSVVYGQEKSPSHVYLQTERIIREVHLLRQHLNVHDLARDPGVQVKKRPLHVYAKSLELLEKIARAQRKKGMSSTIVGEIPMEKITPSHVFGSTEIILNEIQRLKSHLRISAKISEPEFVAGKTPSDVYENMWRASYLMDNVAGQVKPSDPYSATLKIMAEIRLIAAHRGIRITNHEVAVKSGIKPKNVNIQGFKNLYKVAKIQRKLGMLPVTVAGFPHGNINPDDVYDTANTLIAELIRIKVHLGISMPPPAAQASTINIRPRDVLAKMEGIGLTLDNILISI